MAIAPLKRNRLKTPQQSTKKHPRPARFNHPRLAINGVNHPRLGISFCFVGLIESARVISAQCRLISINLDWPCVCYRYLKGHFDGQMTRIQKRKRASLKLHFHMSMNPETQDSSYKVLIVVVAWRQFYTTSVVVVSEIRWRWIDDACHSFVWPEHEEPRVRNPIDARDAMFLCGLLILVDWTKLLRWWMNTL